MALIASYQDIRYRKIPNEVVIAIAFIGGLFVCLNGYFYHIFTSLIVLAIGMVLFQIKVLAAGDSKLFAAFSLMIAPKFMVITTCLILIAGGILAIAQWAVSKVTENAEWVTRGVPYAVPICLASLLGITASL